MSTSPTAARPRFLSRYLRPRFRLRTFLLLVTLVCCWLGWHIHGARRQKDVVEAVSDYGGWVRYSYQVDEDFTYDPKGRSWVPAWALERVGPDFFHPVVQVNFVYSEDSGTREENANNAPAPLDRVAELSRLRGLYLQGPQANDNNLAEVAKLRRLERLMIWDATDVTDEGTAHLRSLRRLTYIHLTESKITDKSLATFSHMPQLEGLCLQFNRFTSDGVIQLASLPRLRDLWVCGRAGETAAITDSSLEFLLQHSDLGDLGVQNTRVSDEFLAKLKVRFPKCSTHK